MPAPSLRKASPTKCFSRRGPSACAPFSSAITIAIGSEQRLAARTLAQAGGLWRDRTEPPGLERRDPYGAVKSPSQVISRAATAVGWDRAFESGSLQR